MKKMKCIAVAACFAWILFSCDQGLDVSNKNEAGRIERKAGDAKYNDGDYTFYFKNGKTINGDCDGYSLDLNGKTTIYEWYQADILDWVKRLKGVGVEYELFRNGGFKYCWVRFDTNLLKSVGTTYVHSAAKSTVFRNGKSVTFTSQTLNWSSDAPNLCIELKGSIWVGGASPIPDAVKALRSIGVPIIGTRERTRLTRHCVIVDPTDLFIVQSYD